MKFQSLHIKRSHTHDQILQIWISSPLTLFSPISASKIAAISACPSSKVCRLYSPQHGRGEDLWWQRQLCCLKNLERDRGAMGGTFAGWDLDIFSQGSVGWFEDVCNWKLGNQFWENAKKVLMKCLAAKNVGDAGIFRLLEALDSVWYSWMDEQIDDFQLGRSYPSLLNFLRGHSFPFFIIFPYFSP